MGSFPSDEQNKVIESVIAGASALIISGPGCGKSRTAIEIALRKVASFKGEPHRKVLFLSFSNAAVQRLASSAGVHFSQKDSVRLRFATFHSLAAELLSHYGRFVGLPCRSRVIDKLEERLIAVQADWAIDGLPYQSNLMSLAQQQGLLAFDVLIPLATSLLDQCPVIRSVVSRRFPLIVVDEFQDTSEQQWHFLRAVGSESQVLALGDPNQIIYSSLHAATEKRLGEFEAWKGVEADRTLAQNFRCNRADILLFAEALLNGTAYNKKKESPVQFGNYFRTELRANLALLWKQIQDKIGAGQTIGFLVPSNTLVEDIAVGLRKPPSKSGVKFPVYAQMARDEAACDAVLLSLAALRDFALIPSTLAAQKAAVALIAMNSSWNSRVRPRKTHVDTMAAALGASSPNDGSAFGKLLGELATSANLTTCVPTLVEAFSSLSGFKKAATRMEAHVGLAYRKVDPVDAQGSLYDELLQNRRPKGLFGYEAFEGKTHILTFNKSKGREFDYVVMVVDPRQESTKTPLDEKRRLYYVTATRAKKWLGVVYFGKELGRVLGPVLAPAQSH
jgi:DNA helicase-2/ATP-dependent DNA helicase PcrA